MEKRKKILKRVLIAVVAIVIICIIATIGIGNYFVDYAIARTGDGGNREVIEDNIIVENDDTSKDIIEINRKKAKLEGAEWDNNAKKEQVEIIANDGITLRGTKYITNDNTNKWAIIIHGYRSNPKEVLTTGQHFSEKGYNVLIPSMRACGESDGDYIGMGWLDKEDLKLWTNLIINENEDAEIVLHGTSMGGATVLMASGENLPTNVKCIVADCGYTSVWDIFASEAKARFNLPEFPVLYMFQLVANIRAGYDIKEASSLEQVKNSKTPILFIHGSADDFVPQYMCDELYEAASCEKEKLIIENAGHGEAKYKEPDTYYNKVFEFTQKYILES